MKRRTGLVAVFFSIFWICPADATEATVSTQVCEPLRKNAPLQLTPADDSDLYLSVEENMKRAVETAGHKVEKTAGLELYYSLVETAVEIRQSGPSLGRIEVRTVNREVRSQLLVNVWSNKQDSLLGGRKTESGLRVSNVLIATLELKRQDNGRCVWRGEGAVELGAVTAKDVARALVDVLATRLGQAIDGAQVPLR